MLVRKKLYVFQFFGVSFFCIKISALTFFEVKYEREKMGEDGSSNLDKLRRDADMREDIGEQVQTNIQPNIKHGWGIFNLRGLTTLYFM